MSMKLYLAAIALIAVLAPCGAFAQADQTVTVQHPWARATVQGMSTGVVYMTLTSPVPDTLETASTPVAARASVHETRMNGTVMTMRPVDGGLPLPAGKPVTLAPSGYHIMLEGLHAPLRPGVDVPLHLTFQHAPPLDIQVKVEPTGSAAVSQQAMPGMGNGK